LNELKRWRLSATTARSFGFYPVTESTSRFRQNQPAVGPIDKKIEQLRQLAGPGSDSLSLAVIHATIDSLKAEKASFKCEGRK
jgi:hypothetical protein